MADISHDSANFTSGWVWLILILHFCLWIMDEIELLNSICLKKKKKQIESDLGGYVNKYT